MLRISKIFQGLHIGTTPPVVATDSARYALPPFLRNIQGNRYLSNSPIKPKNTDSESELVSVTKYFENRSIFITGATGFVGKVLVEKLLRSCTNVGAIYVLIRPSRGISPQERLPKMLASSIFSVLRKHKPELLDKVIPISGDIGSPRLGISHQDMLVLAEEVSVVFHSAAYLSFTMPLTFALEMNLGGVRNVIEMSKEMKKLSSIVYVSTAYSNSERHQTPIEEIVYPTPFHPDTCLQFFSKMDELKILESITPDLLCGKPNTYVLSKHLAEKWLELEAKKSNLPVCIVRPSLVAPIYKDPVELTGWMDNIMGVGVSFNGIVHGLNYISPGIPQVKVDIIPADYLVKIMIAAAWETGTRAKAEAEASEDESTIENCRVYNACIGHFNSIRLGHFSQLVAQEARKTPFSNIVVPPSGKLTMAGWWEFLNFLKVGLPCIFMDSPAVLRGQKPRMWIRFKIATGGLKVVTFFKTTEFTFMSNNVKNVRAKIPDGEKQKFDLNMEELNWEEYAQKCALGLRRYLAKQDDSTIPAARKRLKRLQRIYFMVDVSVVCTFTTLFIFVVSRF